MEADEEGVIAKNTYGGPLLLRTEFERDGAETTYQYMYNAHGDVVTLLTDEAVVATYYYDSFGNILDQTGNVSNSILYAGYQYDVETGLYYINARMYDPVTARFLQADTYLGNTNDPLSLNLYTYCLNNPHKYVDPSGHSVLLACLLVAVASFAFGAGMEYVSQKYIEKRDVINYDLILFEGVFNAVIGVASMGMASAGVTAARQAGKLTVRTVTRIAARGVAFGAVEGAIENVGRQMVTGTSLNNLDYGEIASSAGFSGVIGGMGAAAGVGLDALKQSRVLRKMANGAKGKVAHYANFLKDSNVDRALTSADVDIPVEGMGRRIASASVNTNFYVTSEGVAIPQSMYHSLSDVDVRSWYLSQEAKIPELIDYSKSLKEQAYQAFSLRNQYRTAARELMADRIKAEALYITDTNPTWTQIIQKQMDKGLSGDDVYREIIKSSQRSRKSVNRMYGLE